MCFWNLKRSFTIDGITVSDLNSFNTLNRYQKQNIFLQLVSGTIPTHWLHQSSTAIRVYDRIIWLMHNDLINYDGGNRLGFMFTDFKRGGFIEWNLRNPVSAHEITHTYGIRDNYVVTNGSLTYRGDDGVNYILDWCYYYDRRRIPNHKTVDDKRYGSVWWFGNDQGFYK